MPEVRLMSTERLAIINGNQHLCPRLRNTSSSSPSSVIRQNSLPSVQGAGNGRRQSFTPTRGVVMPSLQAHIYIVHVVQLQVCSHHRVKLKQESRVTSNLNISLLLTTFTSRPIIATTPDRTTPQYNTRWQCNAPLTNNTNHPDNTTNPNPSSPDSPTHQPKPTPPNPRPARKSPPPTTQPSLPTKPQITLHSTQPILRLPLRPMRHHRPFRPPRRSPTPRPGRAQPGVLAARGLRVSRLSSEGAVWVFAEGQDG